MKIRDFTTIFAALEFTANATRLGWTVSSIWTDDGYTVLSTGRTYVGRYHVSTNCPL